MFKIARKPSTDPIQEKLRQNKALWNKDISLFVNDLIHFKKMMNGWPSKFFNEKSRITEPVPADPNTIIGALANDFQDLAHRANTIIMEQENYSKNRRKKQVAPTITISPTTPDLSKQLAAFEQKYTLVSEASNPFSRFLTKLLNPTIGTSEAARIRRYRMSLLTACIKSFKDFGKFQVEILKSGRSSIDSSNKLLHRCWSDWILVARGFLTYKVNMPNATNTGGEIETPKELSDIKEQSIQEVENSSNSGKIREDYESEDKTLMGDDVKPPDILPTDYMVLSKKIIEDYKKSLSLISIDDQELFNNFNDIITKFILSPQKEKDKYSKNLVDSYQTLLLELGKLHNTTGSSLFQIMSSVKQNKQASAVKKTAQEFLKKWIGKTIHQLSLFDKTSSYRLDMYKIAEEVRQNLDKIMDLLEKGMDLEALTPLINDNNKKVTALRGLMRGLNNMEK